MTPKYRHMAIASLISAIAWIDASINRALRGSAYSKAHLFKQRDAVLSDPAMSAPPSTDGGWYHRQKNVWPTFLETAQKHGGEEMPAKYLAFVAVTAGMALGALLTVAIVLVP